MKSFVLAIATRTRQVSTVIDNTDKMALRGGLNSVRQALLAAYLDNSIDDVEFAFLYDANSSRESFPYWKFPDFNFDDWDNTECNTELQFARSDVLV